MKDFFISYTQRDRQWAEWIAFELEKAGYVTVIQAWDFRPGSDFILEMQRAAKEAGRTIAVLSPAYLQATYTNVEWAEAMGRDPKGEKGTLLPVRVEDCKPEGLLATRIYIDLVGQEEEGARQALLGGLRHDRVKPISQPRFPSKGPQPRFPGQVDSAVVPPARAGLQAQEMVGAWHVQVADGLGTSWNLSLNSDGSFWLLKQTRGRGDTQAAGIWEFFSDRQLLRLQGSVAGLEGFVHQVVFHALAGGPLAGHDGTYGYKFFRL